jgi:DNA-binding PadR family transcriptional regulator
MATRNRSNPLALAVLICLYERPMHPYEVATTLRERGKHDSVRLNYGSLYAVVQTLEKRGLIEAQETARDGRLPERTVYHLTPAGEVEAHDWLSDLLATPTHEYPAFEAALSFLPAIPPEQAVTLLQERAMRLEVAVAESHAVRELVEKKGLPRLFWVEHQYENAIREAELEFVRRLIRDISSEALEGLEWWRQVHLEPSPPHHAWEWNHASFHEVPARGAGAHGSGHDEGDDQGDGDG